MVTTDKPIFQEFNIDGVQQITPQNALVELQHGTAIMVDVREEPEFKLESIPLNDVFYYPMSRIVEYLQHIPNDKPIIVVSNTGVRSTKVVDLFNRNGLNNSANLDGGISMWKALDLPVEYEISSPCEWDCCCAKK
jgi:rhodanese-related sulfurtransferase